MGLNKEHTRSLDYIAHICPGRGCQAALDGLKPLT